MSLGCRVLTRPSISGKPVYVGDSGTGSRCVRQLRRRRWTGSDCRWREPAQARSGRFVPENERSRAGRYRRAAWALLSNAGDGDGGVYGQVDGEPERLQFLAKVPRVDAEIPTARSGCLAS